MIQTSNSEVKVGWICSRCGASLSPTTISCPYCGPNERVFPITNTPYIGDEWWRTYIKEIKVGDDPNAFPTVNLNGTVINCNEDEMSWRDWLDEMRAHNWGQEHLKEDK